jgi:hypothetical protein
MPEPRAAKSISVTRCDCPSVWIRLHDENGDIFAYACMPLETSVAITQELCDANEAAIEGRPATDDCAGHA